MNNVHIRKLKQEDNPIIATVIRQVLHEFNFDEPSNAREDNELNDLYSVYNHVGNVYYVAVLNSEIVGGVGFRTLCGLDKFCKLKKMYILPSARGFGIGKMLLARLIESAKLAGYEKCYLETCSTLKISIKLYEKFGFVEQTQCIEEAEHYSCDRFYCLDLVKSVERNVN
jgi:putative acetyltransferase